MVPLLASENYEDLINTGLDIADYVDKDLALNILISFFKASPQSELQLRSSLSSPSVGRSNFSTIAIIFFASCIFSYKQIFIQVLF